MRIRISIAAICVLCIGTASQAQQGNKQVKPYVSDGYSNLREGPGQGHTIIVAVPAGATVTLLGNCRAPDDDKSKHQWCQFKWKQYSGWMSYGNVD